MHSSFKTLGKYLYFTNYVTGTNMPNAQQKIRHNLVLLKFWLV